MLYTLSKRYLLENRSSDQRGQSVPSVFGPCLKLGQEVRVEGQVLPRAEPHSGAARPCSAPALRRTECSLSRGVNEMFLF